MNADTSCCCYACKDPAKSYLATYNCEPTTHPKPQWAWRARKQIYRPDFVLNHFVHYSLVTRRILDKPEDELLVCDVLVLFPKYLVATSSNLARNISLAIQ
jgi:hypothetical protein